MLVEQVRYLASLAPGAPGAAEAMAQAERFKAPVDDPGLTADREMPPIAGGATGAYFSYHPAELAASRSVPMFIVRDQRDDRVVPADFEGWRRALAGSSRVTWKEYPGLNHVFVAGQGPPSPDETTGPGTSPPTSSRISPAGSIRYRPKG